jgi:RNA polymerase sigma-70 factor (ECF subfamily)
MGGARAGEVDAFGALVRRYQDRVFTAALRLTRDRANAADVAQQAFLQAWERRQSYDRRWRVSTWLYRIVSNLCVDEHRRRARAAALAPRLEQRPPARPDALAEARERQTRLNGALHGLPGPQRTVLVLRYLDDLSYEEIGRACGMPVNTVKSHLQRGKAALRRHLSAYKEDR